MALAVKDIANKLLHRAWMDESSELLSNMKLQKLLYYQQGFHLAYFGTPLFNEDIVAWQYGPVVPEVYEAYKSFGRAGIKPQVIGIPNEIQKFLVLRATGDNHPFLGYRDKDTFQVVFLEAEFGDVYKH